MGPGLNAGIERKRLSSFTSRVHFWDQPVHHGPSAYRDLIQSTAGELKRMSDETRRPIDVIAHCFGVPLLFEQPSEIIALLGKILLINPSRPLFGFHHFLLQMRDHAAMPSELRAQISEHLLMNPAPKPEQFGNVIQLLLQVPDLMSYYWAIRANFDRYAQDTASERPLDFTMFGDVMSGYLSKPEPAASNLESKLNITILLGEKNPFIAPLAEVAHWQQKLSQAKSQVIPNVGHHVHLEWNAFDARLNDWLNQK